MILFGIIILNFGPADGPTQILDHPRLPVVFRDGRVLPHAGGVQQHQTCRRRSAPTWIITAVLVLGGLTYLGMLFYSMIKFGVTDLG